MTISRRNVIKAGAMLPFIGGLANFSLDQTPVLPEGNSDNIVGKLCLYQRTDNDAKLNIYKLDCIHNAYISVGSGSGKIESTIMTTCKVSDVDYQVVKSIEGHSLLQATIHLKSKGYIEIERDCPFDENAFEVVKLENEKPISRCFVMDKPYFICFEEGDNTLSITLGGNKIAEPELLIKYYDPQKSEIQNTFTDDLFYENCIPQFDKLSCSSGLSCGRLIKKKIT